MTDDRNDDGDLEFASTVAGVNDAFQAKQRGLGRLLAGDDGNVEIVFEGHGLWCGEQTKPE